MGIGSYPNVSTKLAHQKAQEYNLVISKGEDLKLKKYGLKSEKSLKIFIFKILCMIGCGWI